MSVAAYMDAVNRGDLSAAQRLVDAAAKAAGYTVGPVYHGTNKKGLKTIDGGWWSDTKEVTKEFGKEIYTAYLQGPLAEGDALRKIYKKFNGTDIDPDSDEPLYDSEIADAAMSGGPFSKFVIQSGFRGIAVWDESNVISGMAYSTFNPSQIKSADPVTYDDNGQVIPLSRRFNSESSDIRNPRSRIAPKQFPYRYAAYLKAHFPVIWAAGGNIRGNDAFRWWSAYRRGDRSPAVMYWWETTRPAWIARHYGDYRLPGVIAQIKWGVIGNLGVARMKRVVEDAVKRKL